MLLQKDIKTCPCSIFMLLQKGETADKNSIKNFEKKLSINPKMGYVTSKIGY